MASSIIHLAVAKEINKKLKRDEKKLLIGAVAPDISKCLNQTKEKTHFLDSNTTDIPNIERFLKKYKDKLCDDFVMGYFIHLYTDYFWFKFFITEILQDDGVITKLNGEKVKLSGGKDILYLFIYHDYTNLNIQLINKYDLDLEILYEQKIEDIPKIIDEIPYDQLPKLYDNISKIIKNVKEPKEYVFNISNIEKFVSTCTELILSEIDNLS